jgi:hypothetical protein
MVAPGYTIISSPNEFIIEKEKMAPALRLGFFLPN